MLCPLVPAQMHREGEDAMTLGTRERVRPMPASLEDLALRLGDSEHAPDRRDSIGRDALPSDAREARRLGFLTGELR